MGFVDTMKGLAMNAASAFQTPRALADFRRDRALFLGYRAKLLSMNPKSLAFLRRKFLEEVMSEFLNPERSPMAKTELWGAFGSETDWDSILDQYDAALKRSLRGDDQARIDLGILESKLGGNQRGLKGERLMRTELEGLAAILRKLVADVRKETDAISRFVDLRVKLYAKAENKLARARALDELMKKTGNPEARAQQMEGILFLAQDSKTITVARLEMLDPTSELVADWKKTVKDIQNGFPGQEMLEGLEAKIARRLEMRLREVEQSLARMQAAQAA